MSALLLCLENGDVMNVDPFSGDIRWCLNTGGPLFEQRFGEALGSLGGLSPLAEDPPTEFPSSGADATSYRQHSLTLSEEGEESQGFYAEGAASDRLRPPARLPNGAEESRPTFVPGFSPNGSVLYILNNGTLFRRPEFFDVTHLVHPSITILNSNTVHCLEVELETGTVVTGKSSSASSSTTTAGGMKSPVRAAAPPTPKVHILSIIRRTHDHQGMKRDEFAWSAKVSELFIYAIPERKKTNNSGRSQASIEYKHTTTGTPPFFRNTETEPQQDSTFSSKPSPFPSSPCTPCNTPFPHVKVFANGKVQVCSDGNFFEEPLQQQADHIGGRKEEFHRDPHRMPYDSGEDVAEGLGSKGTCTDGAPTLSSYAQRMVHWEEEYSPIIKAFAYIEGTEQLTPIAVQVPMRNSSSSSAFLDDETDDSDKSSSAQLDEDNAAGSSSSSDGYSEELDGAFDFRKVSNKKKNTTKNSAKQSKSSKSRSDKKKEGLSSHRKRTTSTKHPSKDEDLSTMYRCYYEDKKFVFCADEDWPSQVRLHSSAMTRVGSGKVFAPVDTMALQPSLGSLSSGLRHSMGTTGTTAAAGGASNLRMFNGNGGDSTMRSTAATAGGLGQSRDLSATGGGVIARVTPKTQSPLMQGGGALFGIPPSSSSSQMPHPNWKSSLAGMLEPRENATTTTRPPIVYGPPDSSSFEIYNSEKEHNLSSTITASEDNELNDNDAEKLTECPCPPERPSFFLSNFRPVKHLGVGGEGLILLCEHTPTKHTYAVKVVGFRHSSEEETVFKEVRTHAPLDHSNILRLCSCWAEDMTEQLADKLVELEHGEGFSRSPGREYGARKKNNKINYYDDGGRERDVHGEDDGDAAEKDEGEETSDELIGKEEWSVTDSAYSAAGGGPTGWRNKSRVLFIQLEYCPLTLSAWFTTRRRISVQDNTVIAIQLLEAARYLHNHGVVHRDIKPANIFIEKKKLRVKLGDFGLAKAHASGGGGGSGTDSAVPTPVKSNNKSAASQHENDNISTVSHAAAIGSPLYCSPEQRNGGKVGPASDIFSLGLVLLELFMEPATISERIHILEKAKEGQFDIATDSSTRKEEEANDTTTTAGDSCCPAQWIELVRRMTLFDPADRPGTDEVIEALICLKNR